MENLMALSVAVLLLCSCATRNKTQPQAAGGPDTDRASMAGSKLIVTANNALVGRVALVNTGGRFVVLNFPVGQLPAPEQHLNLYRGGLKVGEVRVTGLQYDDNVVADLLAGDSEVGDQARTK